MNRKIIITTISLLFCLGISAQESINLSLAECRKLALEESENLKIADNAKQKAELDKKIVNATFLPSIEGSAVGSYIFPDIDMAGMGMELQMRGTYFAGITLSQPVYTGGKITTARKLARIGESVAENQHKIAKMDVIADADRSYWTYISVARKVAMLESYEMQLDTIYKQVETSTNIGLTTESDLLRIQSRQSDIKYQLQKARNGLELCRMALCKVIGKDWSVNIVATDTVISVKLPGTLDNSIKLRPELQLLQENVNAEEQQVKMALADCLPNIGLSAGYTFYGNIKINGFASDGRGGMIPYTNKIDDGLGIVMLGVKIPILNWGSNIRKIRKAKINVTNAQLDLQSNTRLLEMEVRQAISNLQDSYQLVKTAKIGVNQASENRRVIFNRYKVAMATLTDLLDAQSQWQQAESNLIEAQAQYKISETEYRRVTGTLE